MLACNGEEPEDAGGEAGGGDGVPGKQGEGSFGVGGDREVLPLLLSLYHHPKPGGCEESVLTLPCRPSPLVQLLSLEPELTGASSLRTWEQGQ